MGQPQRLNSVLYGKNLIPVEKLQNMVAMTRPGPSIPMPVTQAEFCAMLYALKMKTSNTTS